MPKIAHYALVWSSLGQIYSLHDHQSRRILNIQPESPEWFTWVGQLSSLSFHGKYGSYTACKERRQRGEGYWYAYARVGGKLTKHYLGKSCNLTVDCLEQVAQQLRFDQTSVPVQSAHRDTSVYPLSSSLFKEEVQAPPASVCLDVYQIGKHGDGNSELLATKLSIPSKRPHLVHRQRLIQRLNQCREHALTLISAPVGFGKSVLLSDWVASSAIPVAWLSLDLQDNELERFFSYFYASLQTQNDHLALSRQFLKASIQPASIEALLILLINKLLGQRNESQEHFVLVLDNYQVITNQSIHQSLSFLLEHLPPYMHLVLATREDPPLPLAQLRGRDEVLELRANDLRFTLEEVYEFFQVVMELGLSEEQCELLQTRAEGWITGLQLAAFSLRGRSDPGTFITTFSGSHHYVVDYLLEEVLNRQHEAVQDFLLQTCILDRLSAPLCDAVRGQLGGQVFLDFLERSNLFLVGLSEERQWYRYYRLFAEALRQHLHQTAPALVPTLHMRASRWYEQQGLFAEAIFHSSLAHNSQPEPYRELLTVRENEILHLLLKGLSNREIAVQLVLSINTVKKHVLNICRKFHVHTRSQVIAKERTLFVGTI